MGIDATLLAAAAGVIATIVASAAFFFVGRRGGRAGELARQVAAKATAEETAKPIVGDAERESESIRKSAVIAGKEELIKLREAWEVEARHRRDEVEREERRLDERESQLEKKFDVLEQRERELSLAGASLAERRSQSPTRSSRSIRSSRRNGGASRRWPECRPTRRSRSSSSAWRRRPMPTPPIGSARSGH